MDCISINLADNGFVLRYDDPQIVARNRDSDGWTDPSRSRVYETADALVSDLSKLLPLMKERSGEKDEADEYKAALAEAFNKGVDT